MNGKQSHVAELTEKQRECLRLVSHNYSSKEIGRKLGISPFAVDQRLRIAVRNLDADNRFDAARLLAATDVVGFEICEPLIYHAPHVHAVGDAGNKDGSGAHRDQGFDTQRNVLREAGALTWPPSQPADPWGFSLISEPRGLQAPLSWQMKVVLAVTIAVLSLFAFGAAIAGLEVLSRIN
jgi:DNA-binding CsgD family transcriptional regulator